jgi:tetratricopeptide (TPR) repeat protein
MRHLIPEIQAPTIIKQLKSNVMFLISTIAFSYMIIFLPLSYLTPSVIKSVWNSIVYLFWVSGCLFGGWYFAHYLIVKAENDSFYLLSLIGFVFLFGLTLGLELLGLVPTRYFIPTIMAFSLFFLFYLITLFADLFLRYDSYLAKSLHFVKETTSFLIVLEVFHIVRIFRQNAPVAHLFSLSNIPELVLFVLKLCTVIYFIWCLRKFVIKIEINDSKQLSLETSLLAISVGIIEIYHWEVHHSLEFWWIGIFALGTSTFYVAQNPTKRKATTPLYIGFMTFLLFLLFDVFHIHFEIPTWQTIISTLSVVVGIFVGTWGFIKKKWFEWKGRISIELSDVEEACREIIAKDGINLVSLSDILTICVISKQFSPCRNIIKDQKIPVDWKRYFEISALCAEFYHDKYIEAETQGNKNTIIDEKRQFGDYIIGLFPGTIRDLYLWDMYSKNEYVTTYVSSDIIGRAKPRNILDKTKRMLSTSLIIVALSSFALNQLPTPLFSLIPSIISKAISWNNFRVNELRLKFAETFEPYQDNSFKYYYAEKIADWIQNWEDYKGVQEDDIIFLSSEDLHKIIHWFELLLNFHKEKDEFCYGIHKRLGILFKAIGEYGKAIEHLNLALKNSKDSDSRDFALSNMAKCYLEEGDKESAVRLLEEIEDDKGYHDSKKLLARDYFSRKRFEKTIKLLDSLPISRLQGEQLFILGESYYQTRNLKEAKRILEQMLDTTEYERIPSFKSMCSLRLGEICFEEEEYFGAAEFIYISLSNRVMKNVSIPGQEAINKILPIYKTSIDIVAQKNPDDYRVNLWYFVYYSYSQEPDAASSYFWRHREYSPGHYEKEFTEFVLRKKGGEDQK